MNIITRCWVASPLFGVTSHDPEIGAAMIDGENVDRPADPREVRDRVRLREIVHPKEAGVPQLDRLPQHGEETEKDRDLDQHRETAATGLIP